MATTKGSNAFCFSAGADGLLRYPRQIAKAWSVIVPNSESNDSQQALLGFTYAAMP